MIEQGVFSLLLPLLAVALDLALGDPPRLPHPVRLLGWAADRLEGWARKRAALRPAGVLCVAFLAFHAGITASFLSRLPFAGPLLALYLAYAGLALGGLLREARRVGDLIEAGDPDAARRALAGLVSRDTSAMDAAAMRRALAETLAENLNDAFVAPFLYLVLAGPAGLWAYKAVSTLDSMWGYRTERWRDLGWAAARADDVLAFAPARITALAMLAAGRLMGLRPVGGWRAVWADGRLTASPNAGLPMAAAARLLHAWMGGPAVYFGRAVDKPVLGPTDGEWDARRLARLRGLVLLSGLVAAACLFLLGLILF